MKQSKLKLVSSAPPASLPRPGETVGRYVVLGELAHGGMAALYVGRLRGPSGFDRLFALKTLSAGLLVDKQARVMFADEARLLSKVTHPNVVQSFEVVEDRGAPFLVMELLRGQALSRVLRRGPLPTPLALWVLGQMAAGLHAVHEAHDADGTPLEIVHRDVSPQNLHVGYEGAVKLIDFGIASGEGRQTRTRTGEIKGKLGYLAPEQFSGTPARHRGVDVWAFGVVAWEALAGRRLFGRDEEASTLNAVLTAEIPDLARAGRIGRDTWSLLRRCLDRDPDARLETLGEVAAALERAARRSDASSASLAAYMAGAFRTERAVEDERFRSMLGAERGSLVDSTGQAPHESLHSVHTRVGRRGGNEVVPRRPIAPWVAVGAAAAALIGTVLALALPRGNESPAPDTIAPTIADSSRTPEPEPPAPLQRAVTIEVGGEVRWVLVDGLRHDERPVRVELAGGASAELEWLAVDGSIHRRTLGSTEVVVVLGADQAPRDDTSEGADSAAERASAPPRSGMRSPRVPRPVPTSERHESESSVDAHSAAGDLWESPF